MVPGRTRAPQRPAIHSWASAPTESAPVGPGEPGASSANGAPPPRLERNEPLGWGKLGQGRCHVEKEEEAFYEWAIWTGKQPFGPSPGGAVPPPSGNSFSPICSEGGNTPGEHTHHPLPSFRPHQEHSSGFAKQTNCSPPGQPAWQQVPGPSATTQFLDFILVNWPIWLFLTSFKNSSALLCPSLDTSEEEPREAGSVGRWNWDGDDLRLPLAWAGRSCEWQSPSEWLGGHLRAGPVCLDGKRVCMCPSPSGQEKQTCLPASAKPSLGKQLLCTQTDLQPSSFTCPVLPPAPWRGSKRSQSTSTQSHLTFQTIPWGRHRRQDTKTQQGLWCA